ncbi:putative quinol monooxygenase [Mucilaginibacter endophyticus]|uniref:putative quinol monooxygenase n=1 Tax=Mucilaginibacter endophyticus TaxID=2675003 RepID=UPI00137B0BC8|nr:putative quinol monooxygenase [Mucilaginibacter endophyticus]
MSNSKVIVLAEIPVKPEFLEEVKAISAKALIPTLQEEGVETFYQTVKKDDPNTLVFFEVFKSQQALDEHLAANYTKEFFAAVKDKLSDKPVSSILSEL